ncbi:LON peptidase substrate-binding domain-containing protein [Idiomarina seosinensis]|uniref:LON peptidase substrate-binding domain-containing protein n=1 Tax=Idiomarina seosinensis TaxID=281739 RepID=UPI00384AD0BD
MTQPYEQLPLFPLTAHVLPHGSLRLRIFEPRYTRLVKRCMAEQTDFVICMFDANEGKDSQKYILPYGTAVSITDFEMLEDGFLGITVEGKSRVKIHQHHREPDGLNIGESQRLPAWQPKPATEQHELLIKRLQEIYATYPELGSLYEKPNFDDLSWLCQRWLEILPLDVYTKQDLLKHDNSENVAQYLLQLVA